MQDAFKASVGHGRNLASKIYKSTADQLKLVRRLVHDCLEKEGCDSDFIQRMVLAVNEASMNIIQHAYGNRETEKFIVEIFCDGREFTFCLTDFGPVVDKESIRPRDLDDIRPGGLGVHFMRQLMDQIEYIERPGIEFGNTLQMKKMME